MPRPHPRELILSVLIRSPVSMPSSSVAAESGIEPSEAVGHLRILRARHLVIFHPPSCRGHPAEWSSTEAGA
jgi:hypothetical protein